MVSVVPSIIPILTANAVAANQPKKQKKVNVSKEKKLKDSPLNDKVNCRVFLNNGKVIEGHYEGNWYEDNSDEEGIWIKTDNGMEEINSKDYDRVEYYHKKTVKESSFNNDINDILRIAGVKLTEREDLTKFNRIAGFYHFDTKQFELFPRTTKDIDDEDNIVNDYIHNVHSKDEFTEFHIVRFGIEDIPGEGVVCYIEGDTKRNVEKCYYAILDNYAEDCNIIKYELEYYVGNKPKYIFLNRYGDEELNETVAYTEALIGDWVDNPW